MSVRVQVVAEYARATRLAPATWERITADLSHAGYTPKGKPGGGAGSAHYQVGALTSVTFATAAHTPSEASEVVRRLEGLQAMSQHPLATLSALEALVEPKREQSNIVTVGTTLRSYLEEQITLWAKPTPDMVEELSEDKYYISSWKLELSPSMPWAELHVFRKDTGFHYISFCDENLLLSRLPTAARRKVELTLPMLKIAGDLLADTLSRQTSSRLSGSLLSGDADTRKSETAADPLPGGKATAPRDQPAQTELGTPQSQDMGERENSQLSSDSRAGRSRQRLWSDRHESGLVAEHGSAA